MQYALLTYRNTHNLGDEIQSIAARPFLPRVDRFLERDYLAQVEIDDGDYVAVIANGWFTHRPENWPPPPGVVPLLVSVHLAEATMRMGKIDEPATAFLLGDQLVEYLRHWGPIGARDVRTLELLESAGVPAYFSGCLTLTLERDSEAVRGDEVVLTDVSDAVVTAVRNGSGRPVVCLSHRDVTMTGPEARMRRAEELLGRYQRAHCVITSRLHAALPCLAYGTPVLLVRPEQDLERLEGLDLLFRSCSEAEFVAGSVEFDPGDPPANDLDHLRFRSALVDGVTDWVARLEAGDVPATGPEIGVGQREATLWGLLGVANRDRRALRAEMEVARASVADLRARAVALEASRSWRLARRLSAARGRLRRVLSR